MKNKMSRNFTDINPKTRAPSQLGINTLTCGISYSVPSISDIVGSTRVHQGVRIFPVVCHMGIEQLALLTSITSKINPASYTWPV
jgi:hypothetical protein